MKTTKIAVAAIAVLGTFCISSQAAPPSNDDFDNRVLLNGTNLTTAAGNANATKEAGEPNIEGNAGGKSVWWTWAAPQNGMVTVKTAGSTFDTLLGVFTGSSVTNLAPVASGDDTLGAEPLTSLVTFHTPAGAVFQIVVDSYRGDFGEIASGDILLSLDFVFDRYTVSLSVNDTNRGAVSIMPMPDADGHYLVGTAATVTAQPFPGWYFVIGRKGSLPALAKGMGAGRRRECWHFI